MRRFIYHIGIWLCLCVIFLIANWWRRPQFTVDSKKTWVAGIACIRKHGEKVMESKLVCIVPLRSSDSTSSFLLLEPALPSLVDGL